ncbi:MAG: crotonase/enoyl-CoA hydratase family protein [Deltaproteobacteria bacterium]|nr:crotonase/enoyl-CoA hydratase family protein [Deltaproteobacteria bacterium]
MSERVSVRIDDGIARIHVDDGKVNALSAALMGELDAALTEAEAAGAVVVLSGRDGMFSAGFDLGTFRRGHDATMEMLRAGAGLILRLLAFPQPVLTVAAGHVYPAGAFLMLSADARFGAAGPWRIGLNEVAIGLTVPSFVVELARHRLSPPGFTRIQSAAMFGPEDALRLGYLDRVIEPAALPGEVDAEARRLRALDLTAFTGTKARINERAIAAIRAAADAELGTPAC